MITKPQNISVYIDGGTGDHTLRSRSSGQVTIAGGAGDDLIDLVGSEAVVMAGSGNTILDVNTGGFDAARARITGSETFSEITVFTGGGIVMDEDGGFVLRTASLNIDSGASSTAFLDLTNNSMIIDYSGPSPLATLQSLITSGYSGGTWTGSGIRSADADASTFGVGYAEADELGLSEFAGQPVDDTTVLVKFAFYGDANLDGSVTLPDFNRLAAHYGMLSGAVWSDGDFDYNGNVNLHDFDLLAANFGQSLDGGGNGGSNAPQQCYTCEDLLEMLLNWPHP